MEYLKDTKKIIDKLKKVCTAMSKFNLNSPCLLQILRVNGEFELILTHNPNNGDRLDFYKIFSTVTYDNFEISEEDENCFKTGDDRCSVSLITSSFPFINPDLNCRMVDNFNYYNNMRYEYSLDSFYVFPKFVLKAIKEEKIKGFSMSFRNYQDGKGTFNFYIDIDEDKRFNSNTLFIYNSEKLDRLYNLNILPFEKNNSISELYMQHNIKCVSYLHLDTEEWEKQFENNKYMNAMQLKGANNQDFVIYHNDFMQKKIINGLITKRYEFSTDNAINKSNIASLYFNIGLNNSIYQYFKYRYYEYGVI